MNESNPLGAAVLFQLGPVAVTHTVLTTWGVMLLLWLASRLLMRGLQLQPGPWQTAAEGVIEAIRDVIGEMLTPQQARQVLPFVATLWIYLVLANLVGLIPGLHSPTGDLSATSALALLVFLSVHWFGIRANGLRAYLRHYLTPTPLLLPFHLISEITRTVALAVRLFGNIMSLEMAALLILWVAGLLAPVPILMLHIVEALVQAYIFGMLALIYIAGGLQSQQLQQQKEAL
ncbi:F0F1 ATP synthase subunit A [Sedimenticola hydrogenitrophicus]|uniref:F0F1 ATP synthase subunit A n=1 Tax=Sedimenticola hydrogenitrophicus TaxID=2967975 RepID=UPI0021A5F9E2|nr:F0F1 ATP synthase subunit A [Sedimenticola hydrogenitrophicus]